MKLKNILYSVCFGAHLNNEYLTLSVFVFFCLSLHTVMKQDEESDRQRDEGKEENSYEDNRANFYLLH